MRPTTVRCATRWPRSVTTRWRRLTQQARALITLPAAAAGAGTALTVATRSCPPCRRWWSPVQEWFSRRLCWPGRPLAPQTSVSEKRSHVLWNETAHCCAGAEHAAARHEQVDGRPREVASPDTRKNVLKLAQADCWAGTITRDLMPTRPTTWSGGRMSARYDVRDGREAELVHQGVVTDAQHDEGGRTALNICEQ